MKTITTHMTLGHLRTALQAANPDARVEFEDGRAPNCIGSYRMNYSELAIGVDGGHRVEQTEVHGYAGYPGESGAHSVCIVDAATVADLIRALDLAELTDFEGYKGGTYTMWDTTPLSRAEHGDPGDVIVGIDTTDPELVRILVLTEDPPGIDPQSKELPPADVAAERVGEFLKHFGDGLVDSASGRPLYARDLEALRQAAERVPR